MSKVAFGVELFQYLDAPTLVEEIKLAERLGFDTVWLGDSQLLWRELYVLLGAAAATRLSSPPAGSPSTQEGI